ncbi:MAG TPA: glycerol kinase GlpK [Bellilinea sp.]|nr:glycerol kinase GlpK [Bellilinea sp.]
MTKIIASIDQGTTSTRCILFNELGKIVGQDQKEHRQIFPRPGWVEHDPLEILENVQQVVNNALDRSNFSFGDLAALGITNQRETTVMWDRRDGKPYQNAIVWQDTRTDGICAQLKDASHEELFRQSAGLPIATYFSGPKIRWILDNSPLTRSDAKTGYALFGTIDSWLIWNLTGGPDGGIHVTDVTNASRTMLMNLRSLDWDDQLLEILGISRNCLPKIESSSQVYGYAKFFGGVPIASDLGDQQAALFGQTCFSPGEAKNTYGTGCFMLLNTGTEIIPSKSGLLTTLGYKLGDSPAKYCLEGSIAFAGALVQWLRDNLHLIQTSAEIETLANSVQDTGGMYLVPAFSGLFAPYWRSDARGVMVGLTQFVNSGHLARAVLEATAYQTREVLDAMEADSGVRLTVLKVDGGMVKNELLMQFQADLLNVPVARPLITETTALGAAYAAGLAVGYWPDLYTLRNQWVADRRWLPGMDADKRNRLFTGWKKAVTRTFDWIDA